MADENIISNAAKASGIEGLQRALADFRTGARSAQDTLRDLTAFVEKNRGANKEVKTSFDALNVILKSVSSSATLTNTELSSLRDSIKATGDEMAEAQGIITEQGQMELESRRRTSQESIRILMSEGKMSELARGRVGAFNNSIREAEIENFRMRMEGQVAWGKFLQSQSGIVTKVQGSVIGGWAKVKQHGAAAAEAIGGFFGQTGGQMAAMAGPMGAFILAMALLKKVVEGSSQAAADAAKTGLGSAQGYTAAIAAGAQFNNALMAAVPLSVKLRSELQEALVSSRGEFGFSLIEKRGEATSAMGLSAEQLMSRRRAIVQAAADIMFIGKAYGISGDEAVKAGSALAAVANPSNPRGTTYSMFAMADYANRLGLPMNKLMETFSAFSDVTMNSGTSLETATRQTMAFYESIDRAARLTPTLSNMSDFRKQQEAKALAASIAGIDEKVLMAINMKPGQTFSSSIRGLLGPTGESSIAGRQNAILELMKQQNLIPSGPGDKDREAKAFALASMLGVQGKPTDLVRMGTEIGTFAQTKGMTNETLASRMQDLQARNIDDAINSSKSVGQKVAMGTDIMDVIAGLLENILNTLRNGITVHMFGGGRSEPTAAPPPTSASYQDVVSQSRPARRPKAVSAIRRGL